MSALQQPAPTPLDAPHRQRRLQVLARSMDLYLTIEDFSQQWLDQVCGPDLSPS